MPIEELVVESGLPEVIFAPREEKRVSDISLELGESFFSGRYHFEIFNYRYLVIHSSGPFRKTLGYEVCIRTLDPKPRRKLKIAWRSVMSCMTFSLVSVLAYTSGLIPKSGITGAVSVACALLSLALACALTQDTYVFYSRAARTPLATFPCWRRDRERLRRFLKTLVAFNCRLEGRPDFPDINEALNAELREHRRLMEEGIITRRDYERAKARILELHR